MDKKEILKEINSLKNTIIHKLSVLGASVNIVNNKRNCRLYNELLGNFYKGFYDMPSSEIKKEYKLSGEKSMGYLMPVEHLKYKLRFLQDVDKYLNNASYLDSNDDIAGFALYGLHKGEKFRGDFKINNKTIPITDLRKFNSLEKLQKLVEDSLSKAMKGSDLNANISMLKNALMRQLPAHFHNEKAYGKTIGLFNECFYGLNNTDLINSIRYQGYSVSSASINDLMDNKHLAYNLVALNYITRYIDNYDENEYATYKEKVAVVSGILKNAFINKHGVEPCQDLIMTAIKKGKVRKKINSDELPEQLSFFEEEKEIRRREY